MSLAASQHFRRDDQAPHRLFWRQRQFTADASHELRTPLTAMKGQVDVALQRERPQEEYREVLSAVNEEVDRLIRLASSLLTLARADAGKIPLELESIPVHDLVIGAVESLTPLANEKRIEIGSESGEDTTVQVDEDLILNLIDDAIKYTPSGDKVSLGWEMAGDVVELWVKDTGVGISPEHVPHIKDRFYRSTMRAIAPRAASGSAWPLVAG
jgi:signal transduction histidine kinase